MEFSLDFKSFAEPKKRLVLGILLLDISIQSDNKTAAGVSDKVQSFLCKEYVSLSVTR